MKISRMAEEKLAPSWAFEDTKVADFLDENFMNSEEWERVKSLPTDTLTEAQIVEERDVIEKCASDSKAYYYNSDWPENVTSTLKEYASICGIDESKFKAVHPEYFDSITVTANNDKARKEAEVLNDPFKLDEAGDMTHMEESDWEDIHKQSDLEQRPSMEGSVIPVRGGEDYYANSDTQTPRGQNSITEPNAIETLAESEKEDTGARLKRENEERANSREAKHQAWEQDKVDAMEGSDIIPKGNVFATEVMNAQPGLDSDKIHMGVYSDYDLKDMPEKTDGERLAELNEERRQEIQGAPKDDRDFEVQKNPARSISDTFANELKRHIK